MAGLLILSVSLTAGPLILLTSGCSSTQQKDPLHQDAAAVFPRTVAQLDGLKVIADASPANIYTETAGGLIALALGGLGMWARMTHGRVSQNTADVKTLAANTPPLEPPTTLLTGSKLQQSL